MSGGASYRHLSVAPKSCLLKRRLWLHHRLVLMQCTFLALYGGQNRSAGTVLFWLSAIILRQSLPAQTALCIYCLAVGS